MNEVCVDRDPGVAARGRIGRYEVIESLARGGMAELFVARLAARDGFAKQVAIKRVLPELAGDRALADMFVAEARIAATLDHQNIVHVHDVGKDDAGHFLAMELLHGGDVGSIMSAVTRLGGELRLPLAIEIARGACAGLHYAHERRAPSGELLGLVHRDVSPQNLFVTFDGAIKLLDFGIARAAQTMLAGYTRTGARRGKLPYMSPEQCNGDTLDRRSDVFSLSIVLWEMTVGERLYGASGTELATAKAITDHDAPRPSTRKPGYPAELERIVMRGLCRDRLGRYQNADEMQADLEELARTTSRWASARELAGFLAEVFPERARAWRDGKRPSIASPPVLPRHTAVLPPESTATPPEPARAPPSPPRPHESPGSSLAIVTPRAPGAWRSIWIGASIALTGLALAAVVAARGSPSVTPSSGVGSGSGGTEDAHWFQPDDYLVSWVGEGYRGERLDNLLVAKVMPPVRAGTRARLIATNGREIDSEYYWKTRVAIPTELTLGTFAFCSASDYQTRAHMPSNRRGSRLAWWMAGRITDTSRSAAGVVTVANVDCDIAGVRVSSE